MFLFVLARVAAIWMIVTGWPLTQGHWGWRWVLGYLVFATGVAGFEYVARTALRRQIQPYKWKCPICHKRGKQIGVNSNDERVVYAYRDHHNKQVHLMEP